MKTECAAALFIDVVDEIGNGEGGDQNRGRKNDDTETENDDRGSTETFYRIRHGKDTDDGAEGRERPEPERVVKPKLSKNRLHT